MAKYIICCLLICLSIVFCCRKDGEDVLSGLAQAEAIIWDDPEMALAILDTITVPVRDSYQHATWSLLYTQALNQNEIKYRSDSLVQVAVRYFESGKNIHRKAMVWFYAGRVYADLKQPTVAVECYIKARYAALQTPDHRLQYLICLNYGWLCMRQMALNQAKNLLDEAYLHAEKSGIAQCRVIALDYIGRYHAFNQQMDSAAIWLEKSVRLARQIADSSTLRMALNDAAIAYYRIEEYDKAICYLHESIGIEKNTEKLFPSYHNLGDLYRKQGKIDSAVYYLNKALVTDDMYLLRSCYFSLAEINNDAHQWKEAVYYTDLFWQYTDSISLFAHNKDITELHARSEYQRLENINNRIRIENNNVLIAGIVFIICVIIATLALIYFFQRKLLRVECLKMFIQKRLQEQLHVYYENEQEINRCNEIIYTFNRQLVRRPEIEKQHDYHKEWLAYFRNHNEQLQQQNRCLKQEIECCLQTLQEKDKEQFMYDQIVEQNLILQKNVQLLESELLRQMQLTGQLKITPRYLTDEMTLTLFEEVDMIYPDFTRRLSKQYTNLSAIEHLTCCLIKLQFTSSEIGKMTNAGGKSVTRRKYRIKEKMQTYQPDIWKKKSSLDTYLWFY